MTRVLEDQADARVEESQLAEAVFEPVEVEIGDLERLCAGQEGDLGPALVRLADDLQRRFGIAVPKAHVVLFAIAPDGKVEEFAERVDDRNADAVKAARHLVGIVVRRVLELTARVQLGHDDFGGGDALFRMNAGRDPAPVVLHRNRAVGVQSDQDLVAMPCQRLVDRIVADFENHVMKAGAIVGVADVHARTLAHRVEALQDLDAVGAVASLGLIGVGCHSRDIGFPRGKSRVRARAHA